ncbi:hypothetical protein Plhal703r1_c36g0132621 [Plasmopara halstedii]
MKIFFTEKLHTSTVAPGSYAPEQFFTCFGPHAHRPHFSSFATSERLNLNVHKTTSAITPGPGAYTFDTCHQHESTPSNVFASKISRFAPSAPGSTAFRASSIQDNPGPGTYLHSDPSSPSSNQREHQRPHNFAHLVKPSVPAIPQRQQSYGYVLVGADLQRQDLPNLMYSGVGQDTVGPAAYNSHTSMWNDKKSCASSLKSTTKRDVWEENNKLIELPGPGHYDTETTPTFWVSDGQRPRIGARRSRQQRARHSARILSKVPILTQNKPVGGSDLDREQDIQLKEERIERCRQEKSRIVGFRSKTKAFGSTTGRTDVMSHISTPFRNPTNASTPGPGMYIADRTYGSSDQLGRNTSGASILHHRPDGMGFSCATERPCLAYMKTLAAPGPGTYKCETPRSLNQTVKLKLGIGRNGVFGTTSERKIWGEEACTPGPGAYSEFGSFDTKHYLNSAAFKSASVRFTKNASLLAPPHIHCVGDHVSPAVGQYNVSTNLFNVTLNRPDKVDVTSLQTPRAPFLSTQRRSVYETKYASNSPGPGAYLDICDKDGMMFTRSRNACFTLGNEARFRIKPSVPAIVGPGTYSIAGTVGTKSFNVTMSQKDQFPKVPNRRIV